MKIFIFVLTILFCQTKVVSQQKALQFDVISQKTTTWCWAASIEMITKWHNSEIDQLTSAQKIFAGDKEAQKCEKLCPNLIECHQPINNYLANNNCFDVLLEFNKGHLTNLFRNTNFKFYQSNKNFTWECIINEIDKNRPFILRYKPLLGALVSQHDVVVSGYIEYKNYKFLVIRDPWKPCKGDSYLLNFDMFNQKKLEFISTIKIYPKKKHSNYRLENNTYFDNAKTMIDEILNQNYLNNPLQNSNSKIGAYILSYSFDIKQFNIDTTQKNNLLLYLKPDSSNNAIISNLGNNQYMIRQLYPFPQYSFLCCYSTNKIICSNNYKITQGLEKNGQTETSITMVNPKTIEYLLIDELRGISFIIYKNGIETSMLPRRDFIINEKMYYSYNKLKPLEINQILESINKTYLVTPLKQLENPKKSYLTPTSTPKPSQLPREPN